MIYSATGRHGTARFDGRTVTISKRKGFGHSEIVVPLQQITGVSTGRMGIIRYFRVGMASRPDPKWNASGLRHDDLTLLHSSGAATQFDDLRMKIVEALTNVVG